MNNDNNKPDLIIIAGPNGAGKSTVADFLIDNKSISTFVNADTIAKGLSAQVSAKSDILAGKIMLSQLLDHLRKGYSLAFESTMSGRSWSRLLKRAQELGYERTICYIALKSPELAVQRVRQRVKLGGHNIPEDTVKRRYSRSLELFFNHYSNICDSWYFFDNSDESALLLASKNDDNIKVYQQEKYDSYQARYRRSP